MKLKTYIFRWVTLVTLLPATALGLFSSYYVQDLYHQDAIEDIQHSLENISAEISHSLQDAQELMLKLPDSTAMQQFLPVLDEARLNEQHIDYDYKLYILSAFLRQYQSVITLFDTFRVLDVRGNTLLKIRNGKESLTRYESFEPYPLMDKEVLQAEMIKALTELPNDSVSFLELPQTRDELGQETNSVIPDGIVPLNFNGYRVGYLAITIHGDRIDQILDLATPLYNGLLIIAEIDEENSMRNGQILYNDNSLSGFTQAKSSTEKLQNMDKGVIWDAYQKSPYGATQSTNKEQSYYYIEYFPYPDSLTSWLIISEIKQQAFSAPFEHIRTGIWLLSGLAVLGSLLLAHFASRAVATPICHLADNLKTFADGQPPKTIKSPIDEIQQSSRSFDYMAKTLNTAQQEQQKAEKMMLQSAKLASLGQMAAGIGHEINNPLNNIRSLSRLMRRSLEQQAEDSRDKTMLEDICSLDEEVVRASEIVQGVLSFSRQIPDKEFSPISLAELLNTVTALVKQEAKRAQVSIADRDESGCNDKKILGDKGKLQQALVNILLNAIQVSKPGDSIEISIAAGQEKNTIMLTFRDHGSGIDKTIKDQIFDPFFTTKEVGKGTGLGLSISLGIIQTHKGQLSIENAQGGGVLVMVILPLYTIAKILYTKDKQYETKNTDH